MLVQLLIQTQNEGNKSNQSHFLYPGSKIKKNRNLVKKQLIHIIQSNDKKQAKKIILHLLNTNKFT